MLCSFSSVEISFVYPNPTAADVTPQGTKAKRVIAEGRQEVLGTKRSISRENVITVVATINAAGRATPPLLIFKGQRLQPAWFGTTGPAGAKYSVTDSSFTEGPVFVQYIRDFDQFIKDNGLDDGKPHVLVFDGHASHVNFEAIALAKELNIELFLLPSHTSIRMHPPGVAALGIFKKAVTTALTLFAERSGGRIAITPDMVGVIREVWDASFTVSQIKASFEGAGLWPVDMQRVMDRLQETGKRKARPTERPLLTDVPIAITENQLIESLGSRSARKLKENGHVIAGVSICTVMLGEFLKERDITRVEKETATAAKRQR